jgi:hypothetical protein
MDGASGIVALVAVVVIAWLWFRHRRDSAPRAEAQLRRICLGNDEQVERLINGEMTRAPSITRAEAASRAVERYRRDNR